MIGAIDIGGTKIAVGMVDEHGKLLTHLESPTDADKGLAQGLERMATMLRQVAEKSGGTLQGIGIGCTGPVHPEQGTIGNVEFLPGWEGANLVEELSCAFGVPVAIENDADAAALGEWGWGAGRGTQQFILVTIGTGIGGGIILDRKLYRGVDGSHPEIGHHVIDPTGPCCYCGAQGCWEQLASGSALEQWAQNNHPTGKRFNAQHLCEAAGNGDPLALAAILRTARYLGLGFANLVTLFSPEMIAFGGGLMRQQHLFLPSIREAIKANCGLVPNEKVRIVPSKFGAMVGLIGAARVWYDRFTR